MVRRSALDTIGLLDELPASHDIWIRIELAQITEFVPLFEPLVVVGEGGDHLGMSWATIESRRELLDRYEPLYDEMDPEVRRHALKNTYRQEALLYLRSRRWSPRAILAFARAAYYAPTERSNHIAELAASFFGRSGHERARHLRDAVSRRIDELRRE